MTARRALTGVWAALLWAGAASVVAACGGARAEAPAAAERPSPASKQTRQPPPPELPPATDIKVQTSDGVLIQGSLWPGPERRRGTEAPNGAIVLVHELGSDRSEWKPVVSALAEDYTIVAIDMRGHGASTQRVDGSTVDWRSFDATDWALLSADVGAVLEYLSVVEPEGTSISLVGSALGGIAVAMHAGRDPRIFSLALLSPRIAYHGLDIRGSLERMEGRPVLMLSAEADRGSARDTRRLAELITGDTVKIYPRGGHGVGLEGPVVADLVAFLRRTPGAPPPPPGPGESVLPR